MTMHDAWPDIPPGPCEGCTLRKVCGSQQSACQDFAWFVRFGNVIRKSRKPTRRIYTRIFATRGGQS